MSVPCSHWRDGCCLLGRFGGRPSEGSCLQGCTEYDGPVQTVTISAPSRRTCSRPTCDPHAPPAVQAEPRWAPDLDSGVLEICRHCPSEKFRALHDGRPFCLQLGGCINPAKLYDCIRRRACPLGYHDVEVSAPPRA